MKILELFKGTGSFGKSCDPSDEIISVDIMKKFKPTFCGDVKNFDYKKYKWFDMIWTSPPCTEFSVALRTRPRNIPKGMENVRLSFEIINHFKNINPKLKWIMENPKGELRKQPLMKNVPMVTTSYCKYGTPYKKPTDFWYGGFDLELRNECSVRGGFCKGINIQTRKNKNGKDYISRRHQCCLCRGGFEKKEGTGGGGEPKGCNKNMKYHIPTELCDSFYNQIKL